MHPIITQRKREIADLCQRYQVRSLAVFGSAAREGDFKPESSDIDFLIEFAPDSKLSPLKAYFGLRDALAELLGRSVDLLDPTNLENPYLLRQINQEKEPVYEA